MKESKITITREGRCPECYALRTLSIEIMLSGNVQNKIYSYLNCSACEEYFEIDLSEEMKTKVNEIIKIMERIDKGYEKELNKIKESLKDFAEGRFKSGSIYDLFNDLDT